MSEEAMVPPGNSSAVSGVPRRKTWRCFHCDEVFKTRECAAEHFGRFEDCDPICTVGAVKFREMEDLLAMFRNESDPASKTFYEMGARHAGEMRREEERGYAKGLRDGRQWWWKRWTPLNLGFLQGGTK